MTMSKLCSLFIPALSHDISEEQILEQDQSARILNDKIEIKLSFVVKLNTVFILSNCYHFGVVILWHLFITFWQIAVMLAFVLFK